MGYPPLATPGNPYGPLVSFQTQNIFPPGAVYVGPDDSITINFFCPLVAVTLHVSYRLLSPQGEIVSNKDDMVINPTGSGFSFFVIPPSEGFLLSISVGADSVSRGQCFVQAFLQRGVSVANPTLAALLFQGYASNNNRVGFPQSVPEGTLSGRGFSHVVTLTNPLAGQPFTTTVPAGVSWRVKSFFYQLLASAAVVTRTAVFNFTFSGASSNMIVEIPAALTAGLTWVICFIENIQPIFSSNHAVGPLPNDLLFPSGAILLFTVHSIDVADQLQNGSLIVEEFVNS